METENKKPVQEMNDLEKIICPTAQAMGGIALRVPGQGEGKRRRFLFDDRVTCHHVMSRTAGGSELFGEVEKEAFRKLMRRMERFSGVEIMTFAVMKNHFHLLVRVPSREDFLRKFEADTKEKRQARLFEHLKLLYSKGYLNQLKKELNTMKRTGMMDLYEKTIQGYLDRLCSLPHFMKELKERFSRWFNKRHSRRGTLWMERYKSVLVQDGEAARTMAAYIDLNPLRAGLVEDPKDYRWCGYAEAVAGSQRARTGICRALGISRTTWEEKGAEIYRKVLLYDGIETVIEKPVTQEDGSRKREKVVIRRGFEVADAQAQIKAGGRLSPAELLRCRVRYFSEGRVIGSRDFIEKCYHAKPGWFGKDHKKNAKPLPVEGDGLYAMRKLKIENLE